ncbi:MAG: hypothetical protein PHC99_00445 [Methylococcales bacterium]|nr:hypothetical protein [Methylococcales bacterium]
MSNISTDKAVISTDKSIHAYSTTQKMIAKGNSNSSSFESILNQQVNNSSPPSSVNHPKIASTGVSDDMPKEYRDRKLAEMEYNIDHGHIEDMEWTEKGYIPKFRLLFSPEYYAVRDRLAAYYQTPEGQKSSLMFSNPAVKAIVQDKEGNIIAKFYVDDMTGVDPQKITNTAWAGGEGSLSTDESISQLEKRADLTVVKYGNSSKVTDLDLLKYEVNHANEQIKQNPEFRKTYNEMAKAMHPEMTQDVGDVLAFQEKILAA